MCESLVLKLFIVSVIVCASGWHACAWHTGTVRCSSGLPDLAADAPPAPASSQPPTLPPTSSSSPAPPYDPSCVLSLGEGAVKLFSQPVAEIDVNYFARVRVFFAFFHAPHSSPLSSKLPHCIPFSPPSCSRFRAVSIILDAPCLSSLSIRQQVSGRQLHGAL